MIDAPLHRPIYVNGFLPNELSYDSAVYIRRFAKAYVTNILPFAEISNQSLKNSALFGNTIAHQQIAETHGLAFVPVDYGNTIHAPKPPAKLVDPPSFAKLPKRVVLFGCESTGKSQLARQLAAQFKTWNSEEYARTYFTFFGDQGTLADIPRTARGQLASNNTVAGFSNKIAFLDTDLLLTRVWSEVLFGTSPESVNQYAERNLGDYYLLAEIDLPWKPDAQRCLPKLAQRQAFQARCVEYLQHYNLPYAVIHGTGEARLRLAINTVEKLLGKP